ncbi:MAG: 3-oxoacyl-[acyl-carrier-protein] reductase [Deltaproteobacteria bacterium]|nr:3-oxoacyl-[acyl-carrier-protein] reductase [Deltaproteobacteria bacterium]
MNLDLKNKVALITGGTRGIGCAIAKSLAREGVLPLLAYSSNKNAAEKALEELEALYGKAHIFQCDVSSQKDVDKSIEALLKEFSHIDILINNAGVTKDNLLLRMKEEEWDHVIDVNLKGAYLCSQKVLKSMLKQRWGRIINIASVVAEMGNAGQVNYAASKGGLLSFTKSLAREIASRNITVNALTPGFIETDMTAGLPENMKAAMLKNIPVARLGSPEEVGDLVCFLVSEKAAYITGQVIGINGGLYM